MCVVIGKMTKEAKWIAANCNQERQKNISFFLKSSQQKVFRPQQRTIALAIHRFNSPTLLSLGDNVQALSLLG